MTILTELTQDLLNWYQVNGRDLPWRKTADPYHIWISEIMLQQTRVEAVVEHYRRFLTRFPTIVSLASASENEVLELWQGLGYYSRARNLWKAAQLVMERYNGEVPEDYDSFRGLPGVGEYTAGAVGSIAFGQNLLAIDGNLLRIAARLFSIWDDIRQPRTKREIAAKLHPHLPEEAPGDFNQALMDLGSAVCIPKAPRCQICPLVRHCRSQEEGVAAMLPTKKAAAAPRDVPVVVYWLEWDGKILLRQRGQGGFLQGLWELPWIEGDGEPEQTMETSPSYASQLELGEPERVLTHEYVFSHKRWLMRIETYNIQCHSTPSVVEPSATYEWTEQERLEEKAIATVFRQVFDRFG